MNLPAVVHHRVDALTLAYRAELHDDTLRSLKTRAEVARMHGRASWTDRALSWELRVPMRGDGSIWRLRRENHVRAQLDPRGPGGTFELVEEHRAEGKSELRQTNTGFIAEVDLRRGSDVRVRTEPGWTIELVFAAQYLADTSLRDVLDEGMQIASRWANVQEVRVRRVDLAADVANFVIQSDDWRNFVRRSRVKVFPFAWKPTKNGTPTDDGFRDTAQLEVREAELPALVDTYARSRISGIRVGSGDVVARVYDKQEELDAKGDKDKAAAEHARWTAGGWDGNATIARVEFQLRGEALKELGARDPERCITSDGEELDLPRYLSRLWATCLRWLRLARRDDTRRQRTRRSTDPRWSALSRAMFGARDSADLEPIKRRRIRGGATAAQALGALVSCVGAAGKLADVPELPELDTDYREQPSEKLRTMLALISTWGADVLAASLVERWGSPQDACAHVAILVNAARGRFSARAGPGLVRVPPPPQPQEKRLHHG